jgi:hypothetical protein
MVNDNNNHYSSWLVVLMAIEIMDLPINSMVILTIVNDS